MFGAYTIRRKLILDLARAADLRVHSYPHPLPGPDGKEVFVDFILRNPEASTIFLHLAGVHGPEGWLGSSIQEKLIQSLGANYSSQSGGIGHCFVHVVNPFGMAWRRRGNADNIDLNRNGIDFEQRGLPPTKFYLVAKNLAPAKFQSRLGDSLSLIWKAISLGPATISEAVAAGQYETPQGIFFGGQKTSWELKLLKNVLQEHLKQPKKIRILDVHSGLGSFGQESLILDSARDPHHVDQLRQIFKSRIYYSGEAGYPIHGSLGSYLTKVFHKTDVFHLTQEFGAYDPLTTLLALLEENSRWQFGQQADPLRMRLLEKTFYPAKTTWRQSCRDLGVDRYFQWIGAHQ